MSSRKRTGGGIDETDDLAVDVPLDKLVYEDAIEDEFEQEIEWDEADDVDDDSDGDDGHGTFARVLAPSKCVLLCDWRCACAALWLLVAPSLANASLDLC